MTDDTGDRAKARELVGKALIPGLAAAFNQLETRLRQPYAAALTDDDRQHVHAYITARVDAIVDLLNRVGVPDHVWPETTEP